MAPTTATLSEQIATRAANIVDSLEETNYQHGEQIEEDRGIFLCDCAQFVGYVLEAVAPTQYKAIPKETGRRRPRAFEYYVLFHSLDQKAVNGWMPVHHMRNLHPGDLLAWRLPEAGAKPQDTGHVMIVAEPPVLAEDGSYSVEVYDSANKPHFDDTRGEEEGEWPCGVGAGTIRFKVDANDHPVSFLFSPSSPHFEAQAIAMARVQSTH